MNQTLLVADGDAELCQVDLWRGVRDREVISFG
jgi:hypothetical protein